MLDPIYTKPFRKQYRLMQKRGMEIPYLIEIMDMIINEQPLPPRCCNHPLHGDWEGSFDCHIKGDWWFKIRILADFKPWSFACGKTPVKA